MKNDVKGILLTLLAALFFSFGGVLIKLVDYSPLAITSGRCVFSSLVFATYFFLTKRKIKITKSIIFSAIAGLINMTLYVLSNKLTTAANAIILEYTAPIDIIIFEYFFLKNKPSKNDIIASICIIVGVIFVVIDGLEADSILGIVLALVAGLFYALLLMSNTFKDSDPPTSLFISHLSCCFIFLPALLNEFTFNSSSNIYLALLGIVPCGIGFLCLSVGLKYAKPLTSSLIASIEPILNPVWVALFYHENMTPLAIIGAAIVLVSNFIYSILESKEKARQQRKQRSTS